VAIDEPVVEWQKELRYLQARNYKREERCESKKTDKRNMLCNFDTFNGFL